jgi:hypothetical protein
MPKVMDLPGWPPDGAGAAARGETFPIHPEQVAIKGVLRIVGNHVDFRCTFQGKDVLYPFSAPDEATAGKLVTILKNKTGASLLSIGMLEIPQD